MPVLLFPTVAYFLVKAFVPVKNPVTGRVEYKEVGVKWAKSDLRDPVQREHAHNYYLTLIPSISQADRDMVASEWADIRHAREEEAIKAEGRRMLAVAKKKVAAKKAMAKAAEVKQRVEAMVADEEKKAVAKAAERKEKKKEEEEEKAQGEKADKKRKFAAMLDESEGVAINIAKLEKKAKGAAEGQKAKAWMDVVMG